MTRNTKYLIGIILVSVLLFAFVAPAWINKISVGGHHAHIPDVPFRLGLDLLGGAHLLYQADFSGIGDTNKADAMQGVRDVVERRVNFFGVAEPVVQVSGTDRLLVDIAGVTDVKQAIALIGQTPLLEFREQGPNNTWTSTGLSGKQLKSASVTFDSRTGKPQVSIQFDAEGTQLFAQLTKRDIGKPIAIVLDGTIISAPTVQSEITDGSAVITGNFTPQESKLLATRLNSGALPVPIKLISQQTIGASLGSKSLHDSLWAGVWGLIFVAVFMIVFYRLPGLTAVLALIVYVLVVLTIYKLLPVTLSLAGIAGFILSLGMAVDANILIFARMKEELRAGRTVPQALNEGFRRAWLSIRDSHVTTLIAAVVLYAFTTSIVKGFALTLGVGVVMSLVTATFVTRVILAAFARPSIAARTWLFD